MIDGRVREDLGVTLKILNRRRLLAYLAGGPSIFASFTLHNSLRFGLHERIADGDVWIE